MLKLSRSHEKYFSTINFRKKSISKKIKSLRYYAIKSFLRIFSDITVDDAFFFSLQLLPVRKKIQSENLS